MRRRRAKCAAAGLAAATMLAMLAAGVPATALADRPSTFTTGFVEGPYSTASSANTWMKRTAALGAGTVVLGVDWAAIAPQEPASGTATDPANPDYHWGALDANVRAATAHGLTVLLTVAGAGGGPPWADGPGRPSSAAPGTWKPSDSALEAFAIAVARRYSGSFNPGTGVLPRVRYYQAWSEPNLPDHLTPQWVKVGGSWTAESPIIYRGLLNAFYAGIKSVNGSDVVVTAGTAPFGDVPGGSRVPPALFVRTLLCVNAKLQSEHCADPAHFNILAHDPYDFGGPYQKALNADDVTLPDFAKLTKPLAAAERDGMALPRGPKPVWVTEFSWDSKPPDPDAVPQSELKQWIPETFYELWTEGVSTICWYLIEDQRPIPNYGSTYQSGMYYDNGKIKPYASSFRFPFLVTPPKNGRAVIWGLTPDSGTVLVQQRTNGHWKTVASFRRSVHAIFTRTITLHGRPLMRATIDHQTSPTWTP